MAKITYTATLPDGEVVTRKSHRTYTHIVAGFQTDHGYWVEGFSGSEAIAQKRAASAAGRILPYSKTKATPNGEREFESVTIIPLVIS